MNKSEAIAVLYEISKAVKDSGSVTSVSLDGSQVSHISTGGYQIRMKVELDTSSKDIIKTITSKYKLTMREQNGYVILNSIND